MPAMNLVILGLSVLATLHLACGQGWTNSWMGQSNDWNSNSWNRNSWNRQSTQRADRAICTASVGAAGSETTIEITVKRASNGWWGSSLQLEFNAASNLAANQVMFRLVLTEFGADDNNGGCTQDNLGNLVRGNRNQRSIWSSWGSTRDGDLGQVDLTGDNMDMGTIRNLPVNDLRDIFGCGIALCTAVEDVPEEMSEWDNSWHNPWNSWGSRRQRERRCMGTIPICCHLGKSEDDAMM